MGFIYWYCDQNCPVGRLVCESGVVRRTMCSSHSEQLESLISQLEEYTTSQRTYGNARFCGLHYFSNRLYATFGKLTCPFFFFFFLGPH